MPHRKVCRGSEWARTAALQTRWRPFRLTHHFVCFGSFAVPVFYCGTHLLPFAICYSLFSCADYFCSLLFIVFQCSSLSTVVCCDQVPVSVVARCSPLLSVVIRCRPPVLGTDLCDQSGCGEAPSATPCAGCRTRRNREGGGSTHNTTHSWKRLQRSRPWRPALACLLFRAITYSLVCFVLFCFVCVNDEIV